MAQSIGVGGQASSFGQREEASISLGCVPTSTARDPQQNLCVPPFDSYFSMIVSVQTFFFHIFNSNFSPLFLFLSLLYQRRLTGATPNSKLGLSTLTIKPAVVSGKGI